MAALFRAGSGGEGDESGGLAAARPVHHAAPEETRLRILAAARALYAERGSRGTTTREIAERAGVNEATLFRHFGSKQTLLAAMREEACKPLVVDALIATLSGDDVAADLRAFARQVVRQMFDLRELMCVSLAEEARGGETPEWRQPEAILAAMARYFRARIAEGRLRGEPMLLARCFLGILFSFVIARKLWEPMWRDPAAVDALVEIFLSGAQPRALDEGVLSHGVERSE